MKVKCNCSCSDKLFDIAIKLQRLERQIKLIHEKNHNNKIQRVTQLDDSIRTQTILLDISYQQENKSILSSISSLYDNFASLNQKISELELKTSIMPSIKENMSKQTTIIYYLQQKHTQSHDIQRKKKNNHFITDQLQSYMPKSINPEKNYLKRNVSQRC